MKGLAGDPPPEVRARLERLVARLEAGTNAARVAGTRAVAVLERTGTPAARRALEDAAQRSGPAVRAEAGAALERMGKGTAPR
ncbi:hypothetical protein [Frigoriglobus tundricola]|uniref:HEAT repeat domain-containing protein n=1 Tax=Frigoriglobus tundricola TaxID=2774151 RepID=A0A6M5YM98_9BACT|nr:hypothetical protein [Frigoriglobus tundricola]QJW95058.1 hypothetical protein FTUN_2584 [Frigoriglobus tundricola]